MKNKLSLKDVEWKSFKIKDLFETFIGSNGLQTPTGSYIPKKDLVASTVPRITVRDTNNGIDSYSESTHNNYRTFENFISVSFMGSVFYHPYQASLDMKVHALIPKKNKLTKNTGMFLIRSLKNNTKLFSYGNQLSSTDLPHQKILLPIDDNSKPHWKFMENYIKQEQKIHAQKIINYYEQKMLKNAFDLLDFKNVEWKTFKFNEIFQKIERGKRLTKANQIKGDTPYISSTSLNNGIDNFIQNDTNIRKYKNTLSVANSGSVGSCFYHQYEYVASDHITNLQTDNGDKHIYLFMSTVIRRLEKKYSFNREINDERIKNEKILLPADENGNPHWEYMRKFMQKLEIEKMNKFLPYIYIYIYIGLLLIWKKIFTTLMQSNGMSFGLKIYVKFNQVHV